MRQDESHSERPWAWVSISIPREDREALRRAAEREGRSVSAHVRYILRPHLADLAREQGTQ